MSPHARVLVLALVVTAMVAWPALPDGPLRSMDVDESRVALAFAADETGEAWVSSALTDDATIVGLTWDDPDDAPEDIEVRVRVDGDWGGWQPVEADDEHAPDPGSPEARDTRGGTPPIVVEGVDEVQFRVGGPEAPQRVFAEIIDVDDPDARRRVEGRPFSADAAPEKPTIRSRSAWDASSCVKRDPDTFAYGDRAAVMFVHHTTNTNTYAQSQVAGLIRGICSYHVNSRGWDDIGYNALIDRFGGVWVGRAGGITKPVIGAHTGGFNAWSTGVAMIGDHESGGAPSAAAQATLVDYAAWKLDVHNVDPTSRPTVTSAGSSRWKAGTDVTLDAISGHRDASYTACPGRSCYVLLDDFIRDVDATGGMKIFGGWPRDAVADDLGSSWEEVVVDVAFTQRADWTAEIRNDRGRAVWRRVGQSSGGTLRWDGRIDGARAPRGAYTMHVEATAAAGRGTASPADHTINLGLPEGTFEDVPSGSTFAEDIAWLSIEGITRGCNPPANTRFCPRDDVTRAQMAAFLRRALSLPDAPHAGFEDVPRTHPFAEDIARLYAAGITRGCSRDPGVRYCPDEPVSRDAMAAFLVRATGATAIAHPGFTDVPASSRFADDIRRLATAGITKGCNPPDNTRYCPHDNVTRQQMAAFIRRART